MSASRPRPFSGSFGIPGAPCHRLSLQEGRPSLRGRNSEMGHTLPTGRGNPGAKMRPVSLGALGRGTLPARLLQALAVSGSSPGTTRQEPLPSGCWRVRWPSSWPLPVSVLQPPGELALFCLHWRCSPQEEARVPLRACVLLSLLATATLAFPLFWSAVATSCLRALAQAVSSQHTPLTSFKSRLKCHLSVGPILTISAKIKILRAGLGPGSRDTCTPHGGVREQSASLVLFLHVEN